MPHRTKAPAAVTEIENMASESFARSDHELAQPLNVMAMGIKLVGEDVNELTSTVKKLQVALLGDSEYNQEGVLSTMKELANRVRSLENSRIYFAGAVAIMAVIWTIAKEFILK
jgi:hypothetical protein